MDRKLFALLIGINDYPAGIRSLRGCINDVEDIHDYLKNYFDHYDLQIESLLNSQATRTNIIQLFRNHLCKAGKDDVVLFHFSGHGSRVVAPKGFEKYEPDGKHESLVCYDSRIKGGLDLADKELAVLFSEVAAARPHILAIFDCCHSGSGIRDVNDPNLCTARYTAERPETRSLDSYLDGYFIKNGAKIPRSKMALMAACDKTERAWEDSQHRGMFTHNLFEVLRKSGRKINYADIFLRTRTAIFNYTRNQNPQLECYERFNAYSTFLDGRIASNSHRYRIYYKENSWWINCGTIHGIPNDPIKEVKIVIHHSQKDRSNADIEISGIATHVDMQESKIKVEQNQLLDINREYRGNINTLPIPPLHVYLKGDKEGIRKMQEVFNQGYVPNIEFAKPPVPTPYEVRCAKGHYRIFNHDTNRVILEIAEYNKENALNILSQLARIEHWERTLKLKNPKTKLNPAEVDFIFYKVREDGEELKHNTNELILKYSKKERKRGGIPYVLKIKNNLDKKLFFTLLHLSPDFGIHSQMPCQYIPYSLDEVILDDGHMLYIPDETYNEVIDTFLLIVSTEKIEEYLFEQEDIGKDQERHTVKIQKSRSDWFTKSITIKTVRHENWTN